MDDVAMEGPLPPLTKIDDDVEGVGVVLCYGTVLC